MQHRWEIGHRGVSGARGGPDPGSTTQPWPALTAATLGAAGAGGASLVATGCWRHLWGLAATTGLAEPMRPVRGLELLVTGAAGALASWLALLLLLGALAALPFDRARPLRALAVLLAPGSAPRVAAVLLGTAVTVLPAGVANAQAPALPAARAPVGPVSGVVTSIAPATPDGETLGPATAPPLPQESPPLQEPPSHPADSAAPEPGWQPTAPPPRHRSAPVSLVSRGSAAPDVVVVRQGDTLWDIAARHLGPEAGASRIAQEWPRWYAANRQVIGPDPDLILPGTQLVPPHGPARTEVAS